ncbi:TIGR02206 family membrane protein [Paenibacillus sp. TRM 82003]|nr:TIGR02206 family membrane protein [Paenibacillus sp. TRM 82003]
MQGEFVLFSAPHLAGLFGLAVTAVALIVFRSVLRGRKVRIGIAVVLVGSELALYTQYTITGTWGWYALPFQLCTITLWISVYVLLTRSRRAYEVAFFLGILGAMQAMLTPYLTVTAPDFRYFHFFIAHIGIIAASIYMTAAEGYRPTVRSLFRAFLWLNVLAVPAAVANRLTGENFMFLARKPSTASLLDALAPWPWYILQLELVALGLCFLLLGIVYAVDRLAGNK